jgi:hypothetical protein
MIVTSVKAVITILPREVITVRSLDCEMTGALIFKLSRGRKIVPDWSKISNTVLFFIEIYMLILSTVIIYISVKQHVYLEQNISK